MPNYSLLRLSQSPHYACSHAERKSVPVDRESGGVGRRTCTFLRPIQADQLHHLDGALLVNKLPDRANGVHPGIDACASPLCFAPFETVSFLPRKRPRPIKFCGASGITICSKVDIASLTSWGVALSAQTETGSPLRSATAMIFVPLPRFVFPTLHPLF